MPTPEETMKKSIGGIVAKIIKDSFPDYDNLRAGISRLERGDISQESLADVTSQLRAVSPAVELTDAVQRYLKGEATRNARDLIVSRNYSGLIRLLVSRMKPEDVNTVALVNPFVDDSRAVARKLCGATISYVTSPGNLETGIITETGAYSGEGDEHLQLPKREPGIIDVWHSAKRGGYQVLCVAAHPEGQLGYAALWAVTTSTGRLGMKDISERFHAVQVTGESVIDPKSRLKMELREGAGNTLTDKVKVRPSSKKGTGCIGAYALELS